MRHTIGVIAMAFGMIGFFAFIGAYFHDLSGAASYDVTRWRGSGQQALPVSPESGRQIFNGRGTCMGCHIIGEDGVGVRGPNLGVSPPQFNEPIGVRAAQAQPDKTAVEHLVQALYEPDAFVGQGFESGVMVPVNGPPTVLSHDDIRSVILFLFQRSGMPITPELEEEIRVAQRPYSGEQAEEEPESGSGRRRNDRLGTNGDPARGREEYMRLTCGRCHQGEGVTPAEGVVTGEGAGAVLAELADAQADVDLLLGIVNHPAPAEGEPPDYGGQLTVQGVSDVVAFMRQAHAEAVASEAANDEGAEAAPTGEETAAPTGEETAAPTEAEGGDAP